MEAHRAMIHVCLFDGDGRHVAEPHVLAVPSCAGDLETVLHQGNGCPEIHVADSGVLLNIFLRLFHVSPCGDALYVVSHLFPSAA